MLRSIFLGGMEMKCFKKMFYAWVGGSDAHYTYQVVNRCG